jgi:hypothetical protein
VWRVELAVLRISILLVLIRIKKSTVILRRSGSCCLGYLMHKHARLSVLV